MSLAILFIIIMLTLLIAWCLEYGIVRGSMAALARLLWVIPIILSLFPETVHKKVTSTSSLKHLEILLDDSFSMKEVLASDGRRLSTHAEKIVKNIIEECRRQGCSPKVSKLSSLAGGVLGGFTPLNDVLGSWLYSLGSNPWIMISDGGDRRPNAEWDPKIKGYGKYANSKTRGLVVGFNPKDYVNIWIESSKAQALSFENQPVEISFTLKRIKPELDQENVQIQVSKGDKSLASINAGFAKGEDKIPLSIHIPPLARGSHFIKVTALPTGQEKTLWDNFFYKQIEVLPNTVGLLHLLGAPSWDGRFLRRYLKSEPKYDMISFYILRDPRDIQLVSERELSLIPFPVNRLFTEELQHFHSIILQNFALYEFLEPAYQENLVKFVKDGGGLLFIGGPRALKIGDFQNSPLSSILPFDLKEGEKGDRINYFSMLRESSGNNNKRYDPNMRFKVESVGLSQEQRALATIYEDFEQLIPSLKSQDNLRGIHILDDVIFKKGESTTLLNARLENGKTQPLVVASYPGKGRALWIFSDSFYQMALAPSDVSSSEQYQNFMRTAIIWLLRQEIMQPLIIRDFSVSLS
ncbi:MAG: hypothetical protein HQK54_12625, partial [Oligoflexales bacterium]|nr:hypothetical protein [Oligoflexales bacterium]